MLPVRGDFFWSNGQLLPKEWLNIDSRGPVAYEVLRVVDGNPVFFAEHLERLTETKRTVNLGKSVNLEQYRKAIEEVCRANGITTGNIEIIETHETSVVRFIPHSYPTEEDYRNGVKVGYFYAERFNPNAKVKNNRLRNRINRFREKRRLYEVILVNREGYVTEGSRSNVFFVDINYNLITAPEKMVLKGITRQIIVQLCKENGLVLVERKIKKSEVQRFVSAFISGTSPGVLPISAMGSKRFEVNHSIVKQIGELYRIKAGL